MIILLSPAKTLDCQSTFPSFNFTQPKFLSSSEQLINQLKTLDVKDIQNIMKLSQPLAELNFNRFQEWLLPFNLTNSRPAIYTFMGDVYLGLKADSFTPEEIDFAQQHLRILSGLYGILKPLDLMQPYRLEMGTKLTKTKVKNLYEFWQKDLTDHLNNELLAAKNNFLVNLASEEYFGAVNHSALKTTLISPRFLDSKNGKYKIISFFAKKARGLMAAWIIHNKITDKAKLKDFDVAGYRFSADHSSVLNPTFIRETPE